MAGVNWEVQIIPIRVVGFDGDFMFLDLYNALLYIRDLPDVTVVNMSFGRSYVSITEDKVQDLEDWIRLLERAFSSDKLYVMAAPDVDPNLEQNLDLCSRTISVGGCFDLPTQLDVPHKIVVGASDSHAPFDKAPFSSFGASSVHLFAPGMDSRALNDALAFLDLESGQVAFSSATSYAAALVTGGAALVAAHRPELRSDPGSLRKVLLNSADMRTSLSGKCDTHALQCGTLNVFRALTFDSPKRHASR